MNVALKLVLVALSLVLSACAPLGMAPIIKSAVPVDQPLTPAAIYIPDCKDTSSGGFLGFMGASDRALGDGICANLWTAAQSRFSVSPDKYVVLPLKMNGPDAEHLQIEPDYEAEQKLGAKYRVVFRKPASYRQTRDAGPNATVSSIEAAVSFSISDAKSGEFINSMGFQVPGSGPRGAKYIVDRVANGLEGPRCDAYYFNSLSFKSALQEIPHCETFSLPERTVVSDDDDDEDD